MLRILIVVAVCSLFARVGFAVYAYQKTIANPDKWDHPVLFISQDSTIYYKLAVNMLRGNGYTADPKGREDITNPFRHNPLYVLALCPILWVGDMDNMADHSIPDEPNAAAEYLFANHKGVVLAAAATNHVWGTLTSLLIVTMIYQLTRESLVKYGHGGCLQYLSGRIVGV